MATKQQHEVAAAAAAAAAAVAAVAFVCWKLKNKPDQARFAFISCSEEEGRASGSDRLLH